MRNDEQQLKQLKRIANNLSFFFWLFVGSVVLTFLGVFVGF